MVVSCKSQFHQIFGQAGCLRHKKKWLLGDGSHLAPGGWNRSYTNETCLRRLQNPCFSGESAYADLVCICPSNSILRAWCKMWD